jgi:hypothetical protein
MSALAITGLSDWEIPQSHGHGQCIVSIHGYIENRVKTGGNRGKPGGKRGKTDKKARRWAEFGGLRGGAGWREQPIFSPRQYSSSSMSGRGTKRGRTKEALGLCGSHGCHDDAVIESPTHDRDEYGNVETIQLCMYHHRDQMRRLQDDQKEWLRKGIEKQRGLKTWASQGEILGADPSMLKKVMAGGILEFDDDYQPQQPIEMQMMMQQQKRQRLIQQPQIPQMHQMQQMQQYCPPMQQMQQMQSPKQLMQQYCPPMQSSPKQLMQAARMMMHPVARCPPQAVRCPPQAMHCPPQAMRCPPQAMQASVGGECIGWCKCGACV